jgi:hypothetical protein
MPWKETSAINERSAMIEWSTRFVYCVGEVNYPLILV